MSALAVTGLVKRFGAAPPVLGPVTLRATLGTVTALLGRSGCGKTTLLRCIGGLETPDAGTIRLDGAPIDPWQVGYVFQEPRLMPWLSVAANIGFGLARRPRAERDALVREALDVVGLSEAASLLPKQLSGGMAQRVALARALAPRPKLLLMDEPFSALDPLTRRRMHAHLLQLCRHYGPTVLLVTHDFDEAIALGDQVVVLHGQPGQVAVGLAPDPAQPRLASAPDIAVTRRKLEALLED